ncbi:hypothetical protein [Sphingomonas sp. PAMC 26617]|uniref:hypothetical protein n=1 Tax=Sphingomonas sp. PAMC 26617 TaxID=1112216 RepID=UPI0002FBA5ED|nr:hypothetical protein [Sphingomonas sp. PAMC 26617]
MSEALESMARGVGTQLIEAERAGNQAVLNTAALSMSLIETAMSARLPIVTCQSALADVSEAHALAVRMRFHLGRAHSRMASDAAGLGISWTAWGDEFPTPEPNTGISSETAGLAA